MVWIVDIISMSFGFADEIPVICKAIDKATDGSRPLLVFAASCNVGGSDNVRWPATHDRVICVHATDGDGNKYGKNPDPMGMPNEYAALGRDVEIKLGPGNSMIRTGTSVATPVAAAVAALTLDLVRAKRGWYLDRKSNQRKNLPGCNDDRESQAVAYDRNLQKLGTCVGMSNVFYKMARGKSRDGYRFIKPWAVFCDKDDDEGDVIYNILKAASQQVRK